MHELHGQRDVPAEQGRDKLSGVSHRDIPDGDEAGGVPELSGRNLQRADGEDEHCFLLELSDGQVPAEHREVDVRVLFGRDVHESDRQYQL